MIRLILSRLFLSTFVWSKFYLIILVRFAQSMKTFLFRRRVGINSLAPDRTQPVGPLNPRGGRWIAIDLIRV